MVDPGSLNYCNSARAECKIYGPSRAIAIAAADFIPERAKESYKPWRVVNYLNAHTAQVPQSF